MSNCPPPRPHRIRGDGLQAPVPEPFVIPCAHAPDGRRDRRSARGLVTVLVLATVAGFLGCGESPAALSPAPLPGVGNDDEWFWRDVLAAPLPGEAAPRDDLLALQPPAARSDALNDLAHAGDPAALTTLMAALRDEQLAVACGAAQDLGLYDHRAALPRLVKGIGPYPVDYDVPIELRAAEASALARLGNPAGMPLILAVLAEGSSDPDPDPLIQWPRTPRMAFTQRLALEGLQALAGTDFGFHSMASVPKRDASILAMRAWWNENREALWERTSLDDPHLKQRIRLLVSHLGAFQLRQVDGARFTLAHLGPAVVPFLSEGLAAGDTYVRLHCLEVMETLAGLVGAKVRGRLAVIASDPLLHDPSTGVAAQAARVAGAAGVPDPLLIALDTRREPEVQLAVTDALAAAGKAEAIAPLQAWWTDARAFTVSPDLRAAVEAALIVLDVERDPEGLLAMLASDDASEVYPALDRLIGITGSDHGIDAAAPPAARAEGIASARTALSQRGASR